MGDKCRRFFLTGAILALLISISPPLTAQETTAEPPPPTTEPPTLEPPTLEPPTAEPPTLEPPTVEPPTVEPPTAMNTELPLPSATNTFLSSTDTVIETTPETDFSDSILEEETDTPTPTTTFTPTETFTSTPTATASPTPTATPTCQAGTLWNAWWSYPNPLPHPSTIPGNFEILKGSFQSTYINNDVPRGVWGQGNSTTRSELEVLRTFPATGWVTSVELALFKSRNGGTETSAGYAVYLDNVLVGSGQPARAGLDNWIINLDVPDGWYSSMRVEIHQTRTQPYARTFFARALLRSTCISTVTFTPSSTITPTYTLTSTPTLTETPTPSITPTNTPEICPPGTEIQGMQGAEGTAAALAPVCYYVNSGFRAEYYDDPDLSGYLVTRIDQTIDSSTYTSFPPQGIDSDTFSVRWTGQIHAINSGTYTFYATADDGVRVTVDGVRIIDDWVYNPLPRSGSIDLGSGHYSIVVEYYEDTGAESMRLEWQMPGWPREIVNGSYFSFSSGGSGEGLYAEYYPLDLSGNPAEMVSRIDREVDFKWGLSSPHPSISADRFFVRWTGQIEPTFSEIYSFYTVSSDGVRLSINGESVIDDWEDQPPTQNSNLVPLQAGQRYDIVIEYYENTGDAVVQLQWESQSQPRDIIQRSSLYPVNLSSGMVVPPSGSTQTFAIHALSRQRLYDIAWNMGVGQNTTQPFHFAVGKVFEDFVLGQFAIPHNGINVSSLRREQLGGSNIVRPDSITDVIEIDPETGDLTLYPASAIWEVKATSFSLIDLYFPDYPGEPHRRAQIAGEIEVASMSPLGQQNRDGSPPIFRLITTSDPQIGIDLIQESEQRSVAFFHGYVYEIQGTNPPLLFAGDLNLINNVSIANYITLHRRIGTPQTLTVYSLNITPPDPTDPDPEQLEDPS